MSGELRCGREPGRVRVRECAEEASIYTVRTKPVGDVVVAGPPRHHPLLHERGLLLTEGLTAHRQSRIPSRASPALASRWRLLRRHLLHRDAPSSQLGSDYVCRPIVAVTSRIGPLGGRAPVRVCDLHAATPLETPRGCATPIGPNCDFESADVALSLRLEENVALLAPDGELARYQRRKFERRLLPLEHAAVVVEDVARSSLGPPVDELSILEALQLGRLRLGAACPCDQRL